MGTVERGDGSVFRDETAFVLGYSGAVGQDIVRQLLVNGVFSKVLLIGRRMVQLPHQPLYANVEQRVIDFDNLEAHKAAFEGAKVGYCALGTTRAEAGKEGFVKVDHDYIVSAAKISKEAGCELFSLVSSQGADANSWFLYMKTKGETERDVKAVEFKHLTIFRPAFLEAERQQVRVGEKLLLFALKPLKSISPAALTVPTLTVAKAMIFDSIIKMTGGENKSEVLDNRAIHHYGSKFDELFSE